MLFCHLLNVIKSDDQKQCCNKTPIHRSVFTFTLQNTLTVWSLSMGCIPFMMNLKQLGVQPSVIFSIIDP